MKPGPGGTVTLPRWLQLMFMAIAEAPWTNIKSMNSEILTYITAGFLAIAAAFHITIDATIFGLWLGFLAGKIGFAMGGAAFKRATYKAAPPHGPDIEDAQAGATVTPEKPAAADDGAVG